MIGALIFKTPKLTGHSEVHLVLSGNTFCKFVVAYSIIYDNIFDWNEGQRILLERLNTS